MSRAVKRHYQIYALYDPKSKLAYLGKSYAKSLAPLYSKHFNGKNIYTSEYFGKIPPLVVPQLSVLGTVDGTYRDAYRYLVAWTRVLLDAGYTMIMQEGTVHYATALMPATQAIYDTIGHQSLDTVLQQGLVAASNTRKQHTKTEDNQIEKECISVQFNMRVFQDDLHTFLAFCDELGLSRKEGFAVLLRNCNYTHNDAESFADAEIKMLKDRLAVQTQALSIAQDKMQKLSLSVHTDVRYQSLLQTIQALITNYCEIALVDAEPFARLKIGRYDQYPNISRYTYPEDEQGCQIIILQGLVYGRGRTPAIFVLGRTTDNQLVKYRRYAKTDYVGVHIPDSAWMYLGAKWIVCWRRAKDGAVELTGSLPIPASLDTLVLEDYIRDRDNQRKLPLDDIIRRASNKDA